MYLNKHINPKKGGKMQMANNTNASPEVLGLIFKSMQLFFTIRQYKRIKSNSNGGSL